MTQATNLGVATTGPKSPTDMFADIDQNIKAALDHHSGSSRPAYAVKDTIWADTSVSGVTTFKYFDGTNDHVLYSVTSAGEISMPAIESKMIFKEVYSLNSSTGFSTTSTSDVSLSDVLSFVPSSPDSNFLISGTARCMVRHSSGGNDARASVKLTYFNSETSAYVSLHENLFGVVNVSPHGSGNANYQYHNLSFLCDVGSEIVKYGDPADSVFLRLRGHVDYASAEVFMYQFNVKVMEYKNV